MKLATVLFALALAPTVATAQIEEPRIPLQTKLTELNRFRVEYAENFNKKDAAALAAMYADDAMINDRDGRVYKGGAQIREYMTAGAASFPHMVIESDSMAIYGNTAVDVGTTRMHPAGAAEIVSRYMVVLRRGMNGWKLVRVAVTPVSGGM
jgi:ketosteroid isomerase-like protein